MNRVFRSFTLAAFAGSLLAAGTSFATSPTSSATASASIVTAIDLQTTQQLVFGQLVADASTAGTVTIAPDGTETASVVVIGNSASHSAAAFTVAGNADSTYVVALPTSVTLTSAGNSADTMSLDTFTSSLSSNIGTLDSSGAGSFTVGATLNVGVAQATGDYSGSFDVTVSYQ